MAEQVKAIPLQGINHHVDKINVVDGMCEDLVNLRFKDGSWRTAGEGRVVYTMKGNHQEWYTQLYIHTNVYRHLLGVRDGQLWWFANLIAKPDEADVTKEIFEFEDITPVAIADVYGDLFIQQTGHLLNVICVSKEDDDKRTYTRLVYKSSTKQYKLVEFDENGEQYDRGLFPFGNVHVNLDISDKNSITTIYNEGIDSWGNQIFVNGEDDWDYEKSSEIYTKPDVWHSMMIEAFSKAREKNLITGPCLIVLALKLYDGTYTCASQPIFVNPCEAIASGEWAYVPMWGEKTSLYKKMDVVTDGMYMPSGFVMKVEGRGEDTWDNTPEIVNKVAYDKHRMWSGKCDDVPIYASSAYGLAGLRTQSGGSFYGNCKSGGIITRVQGASLVISGDFSDIVNNEETFKGIGIFISKVENYYDLTNSKDHYGAVHFQCKQYLSENGHQTAPFRYFANITYEPNRRQLSDMIDSLCGSQFNLLHDINVSELSTGVINVDLSSEKYAGLLSSISSAETLLATAQSRYTYIPKVAYMYNGRCHIANYKSKQFHGYPTDILHLNNHSVKLANGGYLKHTIKGIVEYHDEHLQFPREDMTPVWDGNLITECAPVVIARVTIDTNDGEQVVSRYIRAFNTSIITPGGLPNFIEDLGPILSFPDIRAKKIEIMRVEIFDRNNTYCVRYDEFPLTSHVYLNMAYYIDPKMQPIKWSNMKYLYVFDQEQSYTAKELFDIVAEKNEEEYFANGIKVSKTDNPLYFPAKNTYQIGSSEIVALCSNAIAVGTGQTGAAPLYVFCKDGVYALFVDSSGEMAYTNSRIIARDVCNNAKSVTPIDAGVVFTTDRGLMVIAGDEVEEVGQPLEGEIESIIPNEGLIGKGYSLQKIAELPDDSVVCDDFLAFLKGAIINYNHNERELMVSNPDPRYHYTYVLDREGNWTRRDYTADEYVQNYPTSYRLHYGVMRQVDIESDADNGVFVLTRAIKLDSIGFKELHRVVARGWFETTSKDKCLDLYVQGSYDARRWSTLGIQRRNGKCTDIGTLVERTDCRFFRFVLAGQLTKDSRFDYFEVSSKNSVLGTKIR